MLNGFQRMIQAQVEGVHRQMCDAADELRATEVVGSAGGGAVKVTVSGLGEVLDVTIDPQVIADGETELIQDLVCAGMREALRRAQELKRERLNSCLPLAGLGMDLPDLL